MSDSAGHGANDVYENRQTSYWHYLEWLRGTLPGSLPNEAAEALRKVPAPKAYGFDEHIALKRFIASFL